MDQELKELLEKNLEYNKAIYEQVEKTRKYIFWGRVVEAVKLTIIVVPIILGILYLPPLIKSFFSFYQGLLGGAGGGLIPGAGGGLEGLLQ